MQNSLYSPVGDPQFCSPYIDVDEMRYRVLADQSRVEYRYVHGGFEGTTVKFIYCFPEKEAYEGRFHQFLCPFPGPDEEIASLDKVGEDDKIAFALTHGAYFIETNMGSGSPFANNPDGTMIIRSSAAAAEYSKTVANEMYGVHRVYGYLYGGSGGGYKTMSCMESTDVWDGGVPYIIGSPMALPNCLTTRVYGLRMLRHKLPLIADALDAGGNGDPYAALDQEEAAALTEISQMGFPMRSWFAHNIMGDGALPVLAPGVAMSDPTYFDDFWSKEGYQGYDKNGRASMDRIQLQTKITNVFIPQNPDVQAEAKGRNGADDAWTKMLGGDEEAYLELEAIPTGESLYLCGVNICIKTGEAAGMTLLLDHLSGNRAYIGLCFGFDDLRAALDKVKTGDEVFLDNSDYIAIQSYQRHQVPSADFTVWDQYRNENGKPIYPQRGRLLGPSFAGSGGGSVQSGRINGKMIVYATIMDESAFPWQPDWYRQKVAKENPNRESEIFRLWYADNAFHDDRSHTIDELHITSYLGGLRQAIVDLSQWVEKGIAPIPTTTYKVVDGQVLLPTSAKERGGLQPVVTLMANGDESAYVRSGETVQFTARIEVPPNSGKVTKAEWSFEGEQDFPYRGSLVMENGGTSAIACAEHRYMSAGTYFAVVRCYANREGDASKPFTQIKNICRARVVVK